MITTAEVTRAGAESNANLLRRFTKRVQGASAIKLARANRYASRAKSALKKKKEALKKLAKRTEYEKLKKLGKIKDVFYHRSK